MWFLRGLAGAPALPWLAKIVPAAPLLTPVFTRPAARMPVVTPLFTAIVHDGSRVIDRYGYDDGDLLWSEMTAAMRVAPRTWHVLFGNGVRMWGQAESAP